MLLCPSAMKILSVLWLVYGLLVFLFINLMIARHFFCPLWVMLKVSKKVDAVCSGSLELTKGVCTWGERWRHWHTWERLHRDTEINNVKKKRQSYRIWLKYNRWLEECWPHHNKRIAAVTCSSQNMPKLNMTRNISCWLNHSPQFQYCSPPNIFLYSPRYSLKQKLWKCCSIMSPLWTITEKL